MERTFESKRLVYEPLTVAHCQYLLPMLSNPTHTRYLSFGTIGTKQQLQDMIAGIVMDSNNSMWLIRNKTDGAFIGNCGFLADSEIPNFVYSIDESQKGHGYATEAAVAVIAFGVKKLSYHQVELNIHSKNKASLKVAEKLGFSITQTYQQRYPQDEREEDIFVLRKHFPS